MSDDQDDGSPGDIIFMILVGFGGLLILLGFAAAVIRFFR